MKFVTSGIGSVRLLPLVVAIIIFTASVLGTFSIAPARAQSSIAGLWYLTISYQYESSFKDCATLGGNCVSSGLHTDYITASGVLNVTQLEYGGGNLTTEVHDTQSISGQCSTSVSPTFTTGVQVLSPSVLEAFPDFSSYTEPNCNDSYALNYPNGNMTRVDPWAIMIYNHLQDFPLEDGHVVSVVAQTSRQYNPTVFAGAYDTDQSVVSLNIGIQRLDTYCKQFPFRISISGGGTFVMRSPPVCTKSGSDNQGPISPPANIPSPNSMSLSDGSSASLGGSELTWSLPGYFILDCTNGCSSDSFNFLKNSWSTEVQVNCPSGPCAMVTAVRGASFSISERLNEVAVKVTDGVVKSTALNSSGTIILSGVQGAYNQRVTLNTNENASDLWKNATTAFATVPKPCSTGTVILNSGQPIVGGQTVQFCVRAGQTTKVQFSVPRSLQNTTGLYTLLANSSAIATVASGLNRNGGNSSGELALTAIPTQMPISFVGQSGIDPVSIAVNNTGRGTALVNFQLQFPPPASTNTTTTSTSSTSSVTSTTSTPMTSSSESNTASTTSPTGGGIPELPLQLVGATGFTVILAASYLMIRHRRAAF